MTLILTWFRPAPAIAFDWLVSADNAQPVVTPAMAETLAVVLGAPGADGIPDLQPLAGEAIGALKAVRINAGGAAFLADKDSAIEALGVSITAAGAGDAVRVRIAGVIDDSSWNWSEGPVWLGDAGALVQVPPSTGNLVLIGKAAGATRLIVQPEFVAVLN